MTNAGDNLGLSGPTRQIRIALLASISTSIIIYLFSKPINSIHMPIAGINIPSTYAFWISVISSIYFIASFFFSARFEKLTSHFAVNVDKLKTSAIGQQESLDRHWDEINSRIDRISEQIDRIEPAVSEFHIASIQIQNRIEENTNLPKEINAIEDPKSSSLLHELIKCFRTLSSDVHDVSRTSEDANHIISLSKTELQDLKSLPRPHLEFSEDLNKLEENFVLASRLKHSFFEHQGPLYFSGLYVLFLVLAFLNWFVPFGFDQGLLSAT